MRRYETVEDNRESTENTAEKSQRTLFLSLMLILLSLFTFLTAFTEKDVEKIKIFKREFNRSIMMQGDGSAGKESIAQLGEGADPLKHILHKMRSEFINRELMVKFLTLSEIKELDVYDGDRGLVLVLPEVVLFRKDALELDFVSKKYLRKIQFLIKSLPYEVEIRGYSSREKNPDVNLLKHSAERALLVHQYFTANGVSPFKLQVSGYGDSINAAGAEKDKVEIIFKEKNL